jgi:hypothetical protein
MTILTELQAAPVFLIQAMQHNVALGLAQAAAWLDPLRFIDDDFVEESYYDGAYEEDPDSLVLYALSVARRCFPVTYCQLVERLRGGEGFLQIESAFCTGIHSVYPYLELESLYDMVYGVPLPFVGLDVTSPEFLDEHAEYAALLSEYFELHPTVLPATRWREAHPVIDDDAFEALRPVAERLIRSLIAEDRQPYADLAFLFLFLFSCTGNSLLDFSIDAYFDAGFEPLMWEPDMLTMANEACRELVVVLDAAERAMRLLAADEELRNTLKAHIAALKAAERTEHVANTVVLHWSEGHRAGGIEPGADGATGTDSCLALLRDCYAQAD